MQLIFHYFENTSQAKNLRAKVCVQLRSAYSLYFIPYYKFFKTNKFFVMYV
jgi:hypothetical protein